MSDYRPDPNMPHPDPLERRDLDRINEDGDTNWMKWVFGGLGAALLLAVLAFAFTNDRTTQTASGDRPAASAPASTTGTGSAGGPPARPNAPTSR
jgi:hypothetical protein